MLLYGVVGSHAHGLSGPGSDVDRLGVFAAPTELLLGLDAATVGEHSIVTRDPDCAAHELGKFARLALTANPTLLELLWLPRHEVCSEHGAELLTLRDAFLSERHVRNAYAGYAHQQLRRLLGRHRTATDGRAAADVGRDPQRAAKLGRHCLRLLLQGGELLATGRLDVNASAHFDRLFVAGELAVRAPDAFREVYLEQRAEFDATVSVLPAEADRHTVDAFVRRVRHAQLG